MDHASRALVLVVNVSSTNASSKGLGPASCARPCVAAIGVVETLITEGSTRFATHTRDVVLGGEIDDCLHLISLS